MAIYEYRLIGRRREIEGTVVEQGALFRSSSRSWGRKRDYERVRTLDESESLTAPAVGDSRSREDRIAEFLGDAKYAALLEEMEADELAKAEAKVAAKVAPAPVVAKKADIPTREAIKGLGMAGARDLARSISSDIPLTSWDAMLDGIDEHRA